MNLFEQEPAPPPQAESREAQLQHLAQQVAACTACPLHLTRRQTVFGEGNPDSPLVFVGEGPGETEDLTGRPFVGPAGVLLDQCLAENRLDRRHIYICNTVKSRACTMEGGRYRNRPPNQTEVEACSGWLHQQLSILKPIVIVCLGSVAANHLIHKNFRMLAERGTWFNTSPYAPHIMAALHPAYILRQGGAGLEEARRTLIEDIGAARRRIVELRRASGAAPAPS